MTCGAATRRLVCLWLALASCGHTSAGEPRLQLARVLDCDMGRCSGFGVERPFVLERDATLFSAVVGALVSSKDAVLTGEEPGKTVLVWNGALSSPPNELVIVSGRREAEKQLLQCGTRTMLVEAEPGMVYVDGAGREQGLQVIFTYWTVRWCGKDRPPEVAFAASTDGVALVNGGQIDFYVMFRTVV